MLLLLFCVTTVILEQRSLEKVPQPHSQYYAHPGRELDDGPSRISSGQHHTDTDTESPYNDFTWGKYCKDKSPCIALLSASNHEGIISKIDQRTLTNKHIPKSEANKAEDSLRNRILVRHGYCAIHGCDVIVDYNDYTKNRTMWLSDHGKHKVGPMPPHWNKVASLQRWLPHFDAILQMDMDTVWVDFNTSVYELYESTPTVFFNGSPELVLVRRGEISNCIVDSWWYYGTSPGCRYVKYPQNHKSQTQNLDMPWFWYSLLKCSETYRAGEPLLRATDMVQVEIQRTLPQTDYDCLNPCNGPTKYVDHLMKDPNYENNSKLWVQDCYDLKRPEIRQYTKMVESKMFHNKHLNLQMQWGNKLNFTESIRQSISVHCKDKVGMTNWLNATANVLQSIGCSGKGMAMSCEQVNVQLMHNKLNNWSSNQEHEWALL